MAEAFALLFAKAQLGDSFAREAVYKLAFQRLRGIASALLRRERAGHTLQPTALVSELFLKLHKLETRVLSEDHFFRISARAMRQVLIDHGRGKKSARSFSPETVREHLQVGDSNDFETDLAIKFVFEKLRSMDDLVANTIWLRCVEGMTLPELSRLQNREEWRVRADYDFGLQWMANRLKRYVSQ